MNRRTFLSASAGAWAAARAPLDAAQLFTPARPGPPGTFDVGSRKQVFLDDLLLAEYSRISKFVYRPAKYAQNPIVVADKPWEIETPEDLGGVQLDAQSSLYDPEDKLFKIWYLPRAWKNNYAGWCYAVSRDGYHWEKPDLGIYEFNGSKKNNILAAFDRKIDITFNNVCKDPHESDPRKRFKAMGEIENGQPANTNGGACIAFSPDGLHWDLYPDPVIRHGVNLADAPTMFGWDPKKNKYVAYPRPAHPLAREINGVGIHRHIRTIGYAESDDFIHWTPTRVMLAPDFEDRVDFQYGQFVAGLCADFYVGFLMVHQTHEQTWGVYLLSSRDGFHWNWVDRHTPFMVRGEVGTYDAGYQDMSGPITHAGKHWIYYGAFSGVHGEVNRFGKNRVSIAMATLPEDRWVGLLAGPDQATIVTRPMFFKGSRLWIDIDASNPQDRGRARRNFDECELRAEMLDQSGGRIDAFALDRSKTLLDSGRQEMSWEGGDVSKLAGKPVRLRLAMRNCALYSIQFM